MFALYHYIGGTTVYEAVTKVYATLYVCIATMVAELVNKLVIMNGVVSAEELYNTVLIKIPQYV